MPSVRGLLSVYSGTQSHEEKEKAHTEEKERERVERGKNLQRSRMHSVGSLFSLRSATQTQSQEEKKKAHAQQKERADENSESKHRTEKRSRMHPVVSPNIQRPCNDKVLGRESASR
jgi:hypothetical protein